MTDKTKQEDLRTALSFSALTFNDELANEHLVSFITDYSNRQVLSALEKVKNKAIVYQSGDELGELIDEELVPLSAIEEIEKEYK